MKSKYILLAFALLLVLPFVHGEIYQQGKSFNYNRACFNNGTYCDTSFLCNLTIQAPDSTLIINNQQMTRNGSFYNLTVGAQNIMGVYPPVIMVCSNGVVAGQDTNQIEITGDGRPYRSFPIIYAIILIAFGMLGFNKYLNKLFETQVFTLFAAILFIIVGILILYPGFNYTNWSTLEGMAFGSIFIGLGGIILSKEADRYF